MTKTRFPRPEGPPSADSVSALRALENERAISITCHKPLVSLETGRSFHAALEEKKVPHVWHVHSGVGHDFAVWKADLHHFAPLLFR